jgi:ABC-2 type transport system permease protein
VLERLATTPLGKPGLLAGKALAVIMIMIGQLGDPDRRCAWTRLAAEVYRTLGVARCAGGDLGYGDVRLPCVAPRRPTPRRIGLGLANLIYVILLIGGALIIPVARYPAALRPVIEALPTAALGEGLRAAAHGQLLGWPVLV